MTFSNPPPFKLAMLIVTNDEVRVLVERFKHMTKQREALYTAYLESEEVLSIHKDMRYNRWRDSYAQWHATWREVIYHPLLKEFNINDILRW